MSRSSSAAAYAARHGCTWAQAARRYGVASGAVRKAARRRGLKRALPRLMLALKLVASGEATTRRAAAIHGLRAEDVLAAWNARNPGMRRVWV